MAAFTVIDHTEIASGGAASWSVSSIPSSYDHLLLKMSVRTDNASSHWESLNLTFNNDTTAAHYSWTDISAVGPSTLASSRGTSQGNYRRTFAVLDGGTANAYASNSVWIPHYTSSNYKQLMSDSAEDQNATAASSWLLDLGAGLWQSTATVDRIDIVPNSGNNFKQHSTFTLYGITGA